MVVQAHRVFILLAAAVVLVSCHSKRNPANAEAPAQGASRKPLLPLGSKNLPPATAADLASVMKKVFGKHAPASHPAALTGDFNGDGYEDVAVRVAANHAIVQQDQTGLANWITEDPARVYLAPLNKNVQRLPAKAALVRLHNGEQLLLILHGYGPQGWRNSAARQAYLLANPGSEDATVAIQMLPQLANDPRFPHTARQALCGKLQCVFWNGAFYELYDRTSEKILAAKN